MIAWLICWIWGHKILEKAYTGDQFDTHHRLYPQIKVKGDYYRWEQLPFCLRCGKPNKYFSQGKPRKEEGK